MERVQSDKVTAQCQLMIVMWLLVDSNLYTLFLKFKSPVPSYTIDPLIVNKNFENVI